MGLVSKNDVYNEFVKICNELDGAVTSEKAGSIIKRLEKCKEVLIKEKSDDSKVIVLLFYMYLCEDRIYEACVLIAEKDIYLNQVETIFEGLMPKYIDSKVKSYNDSLSNIVFQKMKESPDTYDEYFKIFQLYYSGRYAQLLIRYSREEDRRIDTIALSDAIKKVVKAEKADKTRRAFYNRELSLNIECLMLAYYTERLEDLSYLKDYSEIKKCVCDAKREYDYEREAIIALSPKWLPRFWINMIHCLNILERYDRTIQINNSMEIPINDTLFYYYVAEAYYSDGNIDRAEQSCKRSVALEANYNNLLLLSQILFTRCSYKESEKTLIETIKLTSQRIETAYLDDSKDYYSERKTSRNIQEIDFRKRLESPYSLLFLCYVFQGNLAKANAFFQEMKDRIGTSDMVVISGHLLKVEQYAQAHVNEVEKERASLKALLNDTNKKYSELKNVITRFTSELVELQLFDDEQKVTSEYWEENISSKMNRIIDEILTNLKKSDKSGYEKKVKFVNERFPRISSEAKEFLVSAEQMYNVFKGNVVMDFAPIMVEYCKVFEVLLWRYLDGNEEYTEEIKNNSKKNKCLGTAEYVIRNASDEKSLGKYKEEIKKITNLRNKSAHKQVTKEDPDVIWIYDLIWMDGKLISLLCSK